MSLILLLLVIILWMAGQAADPIRPRNLQAGLVGFFGFYALLVLIMGVWSRSLARRVRQPNVELGMRRFHHMMTFARLMIPISFGLGVFWLGWGWLVHRYTPVESPIQLPGLIIGIIPPMAAWAGLFWSQYPADRALREQSVLVAIDQGLPVHPLPRFLAYFSANFRTQILFAVVPILLVIFLRDVSVTLYRLVNPSAAITDTVDTLLSLPALAIVYVLAPLVLRRVLNTRPLPDCPLRRRLQRLCERTGLHYRDILLWDTQGYVGNAAVMGVLPQVRYVLLSDLLLETMTDEQIEAVFAHEIGHVVHRHMGWYLMVILTFIFLGIGPGMVIETQVRRWITDENLLQVVLLIGGVGWFWVLFGLLSRRFERQADVYAARTMQLIEPPVMTGLSELGLSEALASMPKTVSVPPVLQPVEKQRAWARLNSFVGPYGATIFASALLRVAQVNNIPTRRREWLHGSIASRMRFIKSIATDPARTRAFDRAMMNVYLLLLLAFCASIGCWLVLEYHAA